METLLQDLRYGLGQLRHNPGFTAVAVITLALGIGANTAIFSVVDAVLLRPLPYPEPNQLISIWESSAQWKSNQVPATGTDFRAWVEQNHVFSTLAAGAIHDPALTGVGEPEHLYGIQVTLSFFKALGVQPSIGRAFLPGECEGQGAHVVILGYGLWERKFGGDRSIVGKAVTLDGEKFTVIGVMPGRFRFPQIWGITEPESYVPFSDDQLRKNREHSLWVIGRLKPGVTIEQAQTEMATIASRLARNDPQSNGGVGVNVESLHTEVERGMRGPLLLLLIAVGFLLLIACANVANMLLGRASRRRREMALRLAVGADRWRILRQLLTESILLAILGCVPGVLLASWGKQWLVTLSPEGMLPQTNAINLNLGVLGFVLAIAVGTGILFGLAPALRASRADLQESLKEGARSLASAGGHRLRNVLVISEVALALLLLIGSGLLLRSLESVLNESLGFNPQNVLTMNINLPKSRYPKADQVSAFDRSVLSRVRALPGVKAAAFSTVVPLITSDGGGVMIEGQPMIPMAKRPWAAGGHVTPGYFDTLAIPLLRGRLFTEADCTDKPKVAVISQQFARAFWPKQNPIGKRFQIDIGPPAWYTVIGVAGDVKPYLEAPTLPIAWLPSAWPDGLLIVRTLVDPNSATKAVEARVWQVDRDLPIYEVETMEQAKTGESGDLRYFNTLLGAFCLISLLLAALGIYAVLAYAVAERRHEIGIRMALGAQKSNVLRLVVGHGMILASVGVGIGVAAALGLTRFLSSMLYGVKPADPFTFVVVSLVLIGVALAACYIPARRATQVDPMVALRYE